MVKTNKTLKTLAKILLASIAILALLSYQRDTEKLRSRVVDFAERQIPEKNYRSWNHNTKVKEIFPVKNRFGDTKVYVLNLETEGTINGNMEVGIVFNNLILASTEEDECLYTKVFPLLRDGQAQLRTGIFSKGHFYNVIYDGEIYYSYDKANFYCD